MVNEEQSGPTVVLACGGKKCCPQVTFKGDGGVRIHDPDVEGTPTIELSRSQAEKLFDVLGQRLFQ